MSSVRVAVDVGGTFTDVCIFDDETQQMRVTKVPSTPHDPMIAVMNGVERGEIDLNEVKLFSHGTTVATNALITRNFPAAALVTTKGFRDVLEIRDGTKDDLWDAYNDVSEPYIRRRDRFEVNERIDYMGRTIVPLDDAEARELAELLKRRGVKTIAVCFVNSYADPRHESRMREILEEVIPDATVSTSAEILPEIFEYPRFNTAVSNAVLAPLVSGYVNRLAGELKDGGYQGDLLLLHSGGGSMTPRMVEKFPVRLAASGIAAGAISAKHIAQQCGYENAVSLDMGGTSTDIALVAGGELRVSQEWQVEYGHPIIFPSIEVLTIGAGGGSLAHIDIAGSLRNGPQSAGADPGPACYDTGGDQPTNTDANVVLGRLGTSLAGGVKQLNRALSEEAIRRVIAEPLGMGLEEAAQATSCRSACCGEAASSSSRSLAASTCPKRSVRGRPIRSARSAVSRGVACRRATCCPSGLRLKERCLSSIRFPRICARIMRARCRCASWSASTITNSPTRASRTSPRQSGCSPRSQTAWVCGSTGPVRRGSKKSSHSVRARIPRTSPMLATRSARFRFRAARSRSCCMSMRSRAAATARPAL